MHRMTAERESLLLRGVLDLCVMSLLDARPVYGYEIAGSLNAQGLPAAVGSIYPLLARMERNGHVVAEEQPSPSGPPRKWWSLTPAGRSALSEGRATWTTVSAAVNILLITAPNPTGSRTDSTTHPNTTPHTEQKAANR
jgi:PadR family transcriptional regulator PadR